MNRLLRPAEFEQWAMQWAVKHGLIEGNMSANERKPAVETSKPKQPIQRPKPIHERYRPHFEALQARHRAIAAGQK